jgi:hypothetical protein
VLDEVRGHRRRSEHRDNEQNEDEAGKRTAHAKK